MLFIANDMPQQLSIRLDDRSYVNHDARKRLLKTEHAQFAYCVSNNLVMVTNKKILFIWYQQIRHPVIYIDENESLEIIIAKLEAYSTNTDGTA